jgi:phage shock protein A
MAAPNVREAENAVRDLKNWIFVFAKEYDLAKEAVDKLHEQVDKVAQKIAQIK